MFCFLILILEIRSANIQSINTPIVRQGFKDSRYVCTFYCLQVSFSRFTFSLTFFDFYKMSPWTYLFPAFICLRNQLNWLKFYNFITWSNKVLHIFWNIFYEGNLPFSRIFPRSNVDLLRITLNWSLLCGFQPFWQNRLKMIPKDA